MRFESQRSDRQAFQNQDEGPMNTLLERIGLCILKETPRFLFQCCNRSSQAVLECLMALMAKLGDGIVCACKELEQKRMGDTAIVVQHNTSCNLPSAEK